MYGGSIVGFNYDHCLSLFFVWDTFKKYWLKIVIPRFWTSRNFAYWKAFEAFGIKNLKIYMKKVIVKVLKRDNEISNKRFDL